MPRRDPLAWIVLLLLASCTGSITDQEPGPADRDGGATPTADAAGAADAAPAGPLYDQLSPDEQQLFDTINAERTMRGLTPVVLRDTLICAARRHSDDVGPKGLCSHTGSDGSSPGTRVQACGGGGWTGEIIACGQQTPRGAVDAWLNSPGHRDIMLDGAKREIGVAVTNNYWTGIFDN